MASSQRIDYVDIAKGISIILVALFHSKLKTVIPELIQPMGLFRLPLFFFLAGLFFSAAPSPAVFIGKKADVLLKPYFVTSLGLWLAFTIAGHGNPFGLLLDILYGNGAILR
jgi:fucose 4-O-acetylase-like acetyltransferase